MKNRGIGLAFPYAFLPIYDKKLTDKFSGNEIGGLSEIITNLLFKHDLKGQCPDFAHARASSVFSLKDNRTVILTRQDFLPDRTADGDLLFTILSNILDFRRSFSSYLNFNSRYEDSSRFCR